MVLKRVTNTVTTGDFTNTFDWEEPLPFILFLSRRKFAAGRHRYFGAKEESQTMG